MIGSSVREALLVLYGMAMASASTETALARVDNSYGTICDYIEWSEKNNG
jgi:hypothetical protein